jgi:hypothetical protein
LIQVSAEKLDRLGSVRRLITRFGILITRFEILITRFGILITRFGMVSGA